MQVIVNVDDAGLHPAVRRAIEGLSAKGTVTSATLMANGPDVENAARIQGVGLGVHLNILRGKSLCEPSSIPSLVGDDGLMLGSYGTLFKRYVTGRLSHTEVELEWSAQIERILDLGVRPTHFDSEKHIHAWPTLMTVATRLAERYGVRWVRRPHQLGGVFVGGKGGLRLKFLAVCAAFQRKPHAVRWPDTVWGIADQGHELLPERFRQYVLGNGLENAVVEICCHPGLPEPGDPPISGDYGALRVDRQWKAEYDALSDPDWQNVVQALGGRFTSYGTVE